MDASPHRPRRLHTPRVLASLGAVLLVAGCAAPARRSAPPPTDRHEPAPVRAEYPGWNGALEAGVVRIAVDVDGQCAVDGEPVSDLRRALRQRTPSDGEVAPVVTVLVEPNAEWRTALPVLDACARAELWNLRWLPQGDTRPPAPWRLPRDAGPPGRRASVEILLQGTTVHYRVRPEPGLVADEVEGPYTSWPRAALDAEGARAVLRSLRAREAVLALPLDLPFGLAFTAVEEIRASGVTVAFRRPPGAE